MVQFPGRHRRRKLRGTTSLALAVLLVATAAASGLRRAVTRPAPLCGIPGAAYQFGAPSAVGRLMSMRSQDVQIVQTPRGPMRLKLFQFQEPTLRVDHCQVSGMVLQLYDDGTYVLSLRGEQNPGFVAAGQSDGGPEVQAAREQEEGVDRQLTRTEAPPFKHLLRNEFHLELLLFGPYAAAELPNEGVGKPILVQLRPRSFWVQRGRAENYYSTGCIDGVRRFFDLFERVELAFYYR